ncbi:MAG TPA: hypothetical protein PKA41_01805 [Verrucomicrobiota bacterium]|nr:hypothetical protein [Verrucomicrobiota bacterium]
MQNLTELTRRLIAADVEFVLVGGFAAIAHGVLRSTLDVDICCRFSEENLLRIQRAVADLHPVHRQRTDLPLDLTPAQCASLKDLYLKTDLGILDCLGEIKAVGDYDEVSRHTVELELPIGRCRVIDLETLIAAKEAMGRDHDRITVRELKEIKKRQSHN